MLPADLLAASQLALPPPPVSIIAHLMPHHCPTTLPLSASPSPHLTSDLPCPYPLCHGLPFASPRELLHRLPSDHSEPRYLSDVLSATLVAGLFPNLAWLRRFGKGETCRGLKVVAHPGSVNARCAAFAAPHRSPRASHPSCRHLPSPCPHPHPHPPLPE